MNHVAIPKSRINELLDKLKQQYRVVAPVLDDGVLLFKEINSSSQAVLTDEITYKSPKEYFFPQVERFLRFDEDGGVTEEKLPPQTVIFGVRPCDLDALKILTAVFTKGKFTDNLFINHRNNTVIIGLGCASEKSGCFCSERGVDKNSSSECDLFLRDMGDHFIADVLTESGVAIINDYLPGVENIDKPSAGTLDVQGALDIPKILPAAGVQAAAVVTGLSDVLGLMDEPQITAAATVTSSHDEMYIPAVPMGTKLLELNTDENTLFNKIDWERISETCMGCGTCTYICPTCHCFEFKDVTEKGAISRYRCWDSCMYPKFTLHTSGHNPRSSKKERFRQRVLHKYLYVKQNFGYTACTGCGRCIRSCPAGMNIKSVVKSIMEELK